MIKINEKIFISADEHNVILQEKGKNSKTDKDTMKILGYYTTIEEALKGLLKKEFRKYLSKKDEVSLEEALKKEEKIRQKITSITKGI